MTPLRQRFIEDMQLRGLSASTQEVYVSAVRRLAAYYGKSPAEITDEELRQYFLYLKTTKKAARSTCTVAICSLKFLYEQTLKRPWPTLRQIRPAKEKKLPIVLSREEVHQVLSCLKSEHQRACLSTIYSCGLRTAEGVRLQVGDIDSARMLIHIHQGKGNKDRYIPLPDQTLELLRAYWLTHRNPVWLFPSRVATNHPGQATKPMATDGTLKAFRLALQASGVTKKATVRTLRHAYATHLLEAGVSLRLIQAYLGHTHLSTTMRYTHLTRETQGPAIEAINGLLADLPWSS
jgi:site-specific recombinase XerD